MRRANRYLEDPEMDDIDHALGRPVDPLGETYRDHYSVDRGSDQATRMRASPWWSEVPLTNAPRLSLFQVTNEGRQALVGHLASINDPWRTYRVTLCCDGDEVSIDLAAKSASQARYHLYLELEWDVPFVQFLRCVTSTRPARPEHTGRPL